MVLSSTGSGQKGCGQQSGYLFFKSSSIVQGGTTATTPHLNR